MMVQTKAFSFFQYHQDPRFQVVTTPDHLAEMERFIDAQPIKAFDYETSGTAWWKHARPCGIAFTAHDPSESRPRNYYVPYRHITGQQQLPPEMVVSSSKRILENPSTAKIAHHIKFDEHMAHTEGIRVRGERHDTMIQAHLYDENVAKGLKIRGLVDLRDDDAQLHDEMLQTELTRLAKFSGLTKTEYKNRYGYSGIDIFMCGAYGGHDTEMTFGLHNFYTDAGVLDFYARIYPTEMKLTHIIGKMERAGVQLDVEYLTNLHSFLLDERAKAEAAFFQAAGVEWFNLGSDDMVRDYLQRGLKLPLYKKTKKGDNLSVDASVLRSFRSRAPHLEHMERWREVEKKISTYTISLLDKCDEFGILHGDFKQIGTVTGRLSCEKPNLQNIATDDEDRMAAAPDGVDPESIKRAFIIQRHERQMQRLFGRQCTLFRLFGDYSQVELRILAGLSGDPRMIDAFLCGRDIHTETEMAVFQTAGPNRRPAKNINFGLSYCLSHIGLASMMNVSNDEAEAFLNRFFEQFPRIIPFRQELWAHCKKNRNQFENPWGRTRRVPKLSSPNKWESERAKRQIIATLIQGTAAELMKETLVRVDDFLEENQCESMLVQTVHDEAQVDGPLEEFQFVAENVKKLAEDYDEFSPVSIIMDMEASTKSWVHKTKLAA